MIKVMPLWFILDDTPILSSHQRVKRYIDQDCLNIVLIHVTHKWRSFVKKSFVDDGDIQLVTNRFDRKTYCTVSGNNFVYSFSFLRNLKYTILFSHLCLYFIDPLTPESSNL